MGNKKLVKTQLVLIFAHCAEGKYCYKQVTGFRVLQFIIKKYEGDTGGSNDPT